MRFAHFFIDRPIFAGVLSIFLVIVGGIAYFSLPVSQYPEVAPPTIVVSSQYPGANAQTVADTVATPIEQEVNGVEGMLYMYSQSTNDGRMQLTISFEIGTDLDKAQVLVQNRVSIAEPRLPEPVRRLGVTTRKNSPDMLMVIHLISPDKTYDQLYISNYALLRVRDELLRKEGVGNIQLFGERQYSMRVWLDPDRIAAISMTADEVVAALQRQNIQVAGGALGEPPLDTERAFQLGLELKGRLKTPDEFEEIVIKSGEDGRVVRLRDVARVEIGALNYLTNSYLSAKPAVVLAVFQRPGSNALQTADDVQEEMKRLAASFPKGLEYRIIYNPTEYISKSLDELVKTILEAIILVVIVILVFLQNWRAAIIPIVAIPVSLIGTFAVMAAMGFSINTLVLFGLVLAVGIVVDDAIVVVENVERRISEGQSARDAARGTMDEVGGALIAMALVLVAVFVPTAFLGGITGQFYSQFAVAIAVSTVISAINSLTLSPALCALLFRGQEKDRPGAVPVWRKPFRAFADRFNRTFDWLSTHYCDLVAKCIRMGLVMLAIYAGLIALTGFSFTRVPTGFIPPQDQGYLIVAVQLPSGSSLARTDEVIRKAEKIILSTPGFTHTASFAGFSGATFTNAPNAGAIFAVMEDFDTRLPKGMTAEALLGQLRQKLGAIQEAFIIAIPPPPVRGVGTSGGFNMMVQDRGGRGTQALFESTFALMMAANQEPGLTGVFTPWSIDTPQLFVDVDRVRAQMLNVPPTNVFETLRVYLGSAYVNDFNLFGRTFRVTAQAAPDFRLTKEDIAKLRTRSTEGYMVPLGSLVTFRDIAGPDRVPRYNLFPAAELNGNSLPGVSTGEALAKMEALAKRVLPDGISFEWTNLSYQQAQQGNTAVYVFMLAVLFVFLALAAQYESWSMPLAIILIVPMCLLSALGGVALMGMDINILTQIGFVVLIGLAAKNAILIVEFARHLEEHGRNRFEAAREAARLRLRPILMTSFAFTLGVVPLLIASGAGAEMRQALGTAVFFGMLGVTAFGLIFTPIFYVLIRGFAVEGWRGLRFREPKAAAA